MGRSRSGRLAEHVEFKVCRASPEKNHGHLVKVSPMHAVQITIAIASSAKRASLNAGVLPQVTVAAGFLKPLCLPFPVSSPAHVVQGHGAPQMTIIGARNLLEALHHRPLERFQRQVLSRAIVSEVTAANYLPCAHLYNYTITDMRLTKKTKPPLFKSSSHIRELVMEDVTRTHPQAAPGNDENGTLALALAFVAVHSDCKGCRSSIFGEILHGMQPACHSLEQTCKDLALCADVRTHTHTYLYRCMRSPPPRLRLCGIPETQPVHVVIP